MQQILWGERVPQKRRKRKVDPLPSSIPYSITGLNDCQIIGHSLSVWDLAGCTTCIDCAVHVFCPGCITKHPTFDKAIPVVCPRHERNEG
jgi:hypothetical protein